MSTSCKFCGRPIVWVTTSAGARLPLDLKPRQLYAELRPKMWQRTFCYESHLDTCPKRPRRWGGHTPDAVVQDDVPDQGAADPATVDTVVLDKDVFGGVA